MADERVSVGRRRGVRAVGVLLGVSVLSGGAGWWAARGIKSPAEVAARTGSPVASRITAPVEFRVLRSTLFTRGTVRFGSPKTVTLSSSASKTGSLVVTSPPVKGVVLVEGSKAADVGGRPVMVLQGNVPMYRDIRPGDHGDDVVELKAALSRLGFKAGSSDVFDGPGQHAVSEWMRSVGYEPFGPTDSQQQQLRTATDAVSKAGEQLVAAQAALAKGADPPSADKVVAADEAVRIAQDRAAAARTDGDRTVALAELTVTQKQAAVVAAQVAVDRAATDVSAVLSVTEAEQAVATATQHIADADAAIARASRKLDSARADAADAAQAVTDAQAVADDANTALANAQSELVRIRALPAPTIQVSPGVFTVDTDSYNASVKAAEAAVTAATAQVRSAATGVRIAQRSTARASDAIADAQAELDSTVAAAAQARDAVKSAELRLAQAHNGSSTAAGGTGAASAGSDPETVLTLAQADLAQAQAALEPARTAAAAAVRAADAQVRLTTLQRLELTKPADTTQLRAAVVSAVKAKTQAQAELLRLEAQIGIVVPANEVVFFPSLPLRVDDSKLAAGDALAGVLMTVATQRVAVDASVDPSDAASLRVGQPAEIEATDLDITIPGTITKIAATPGTDGADASRIYVEVTPNEGSDTAATSGGSQAPMSMLPTGGRKPTLADLNGLSVKVTVPISTTNGKVLAVPTAAVSAAVDGTIRVEVEDTPTGPTRFVTVNAGLRADGYVQIAPIKSIDLTAGDLVVTGTASGQLIQGTPDPNDRPASGRVTDTTNTGPGQ